MAPGSKDVPLEALRGLAAIVVLLSHTVLAFFPCRSAQHYPGCDAGLSFASQPWFASLNGEAAVAFFFVLSGFVLTRSFLMIGETTILLRGALKRWPRLAGPVLLTTIAGWLLFAYGPNAGHIAGPITASPWLTNFGTGSPVDPTLIGALLQGTVLTFFRGDANYNLVLWTMHVEFIGSYVAFSLAFFLYHLGQRRRSLIFFAIAVVWFICHWSAQVYTTFVLGVALAAFFAQQARHVRLGTAMGISLVIIAIYLLGYTSSAGGAYAWITWFSTVTPMKIPVLYVQTTGSLSLLIAIEMCPALKSRLSGPVASWLGEISFPLYLVHMLFICHAASIVFLATQSVWAASAFGVIGSVAMASPLMMFSRWWVRNVNRITESALAVGSTASTSPLVPAATIYAARD